MRHGATTTEGADYTSEFTHIRICDLLFPCNGFGSSYVTIFSVGFVGRINERRIGDCPRFRRIDKRMWCLCVVTARIGGVQINNSRVLGAQIRGIGKRRIDTMHVQSISARRITAFACIVPGYLIPIVNSKPCLLSDLLLRMLLVLGGDRAVFGHGSSSNLGLFL